MNARIKYSLLLVGIGVIIAFLPFNATKSFRLKSDELLATAVSEEGYFTVDQVAMMVNREDSTLQLIDLRTADQFREFNIPGSINIPYIELLSPVWEGTLNQKEVKKIFYGNTEQTANYAWTLATGLGYKNCFIMKGGLNEWFSTVMFSRFEGEQITAAENALFENRFAARRTFTQINSLPDSLKGQYFKAKRIKQMKLDGGCQ